MEITFQKRKSNRLKQMKNVKNENITLEENILTQCKIIEIYQVITKEKRQTLPSKIRKSKEMTLTQINSIYKLPISLKIPTKDTEGQTIFSLKPATKLLH